MSDDRAPILPSNATPLERAAAEALAEIQRVPIPLRDICTPEGCPERLLPYLAWAVSVDRWDPTWSEATKRGVIRASWDVHRHKGTISALRRVVEPLGYLLEVIEWFETDPPGPRGTAALKIGVRDTGITPTMYEELERLIDDARPVSRHITGLDLAGETRGTHYYAAAVYDGDVTAVMPYQPQTVTVSGAHHYGAALDGEDSATVYPA
ncbi:phage tail protein, P2 protein I family [Thiohalospira halophila DSM 15071]|uniref:Phage tail protein, P2 protein I family n=1 Tax=Thiohalospira halophila DSM 15071 TaxID=1123397 RepID=A0A1I1UBG2_9GAMM|nr:phage tail protein I [Thiohalospira halophila]SFD68172.1 phage tail protein, P2 protein I family [Thiohalospira halophila DSM 15071]